MVEAAEIHLRESLAGNLFYMFTPLMNFHFSLGTCIDTRKILYILNWNFVQS